MGYVLDGRLVIERGRLGTILRGCFFSVCGVWCGAVSSGVLYDCAFNPSVRSQPSSHWHGGVAHRYSTVLY